MKIYLLCVGKTDQNFVKEAVEVYENRIVRYIGFEIIYISDIKNAKSMSEQVLKEKEGEQILKYIKPSDLVVLLDEFGKEFRSIDFSKFIEKNMVELRGNLVFIIGGAYGFSQKIYEIAKLKISLSKMTYSHQLIRAIFTEQLYRAFTIIKNEPYHHE